MSARPSRLDAAFPTLVRYSGLALSVALTIALMFGHTEVVAGFVPASGMILYKTVKKAVADPEE